MTGHPEDEARSRVHSLFLGFLRWRISPVPSSIARRDAIASKRSVSRAEGIASSDDDSGDDGLEVDLILTYGLQAHEMSEEAVPAIS